MAHGVRMRTYDCGNGIKMTMAYNPALDGPWINKAEWDNYKNFHYKTQKEIQLERLIAYDRLKQSWISLG
jgi:hypothetical protein